MSHFEVISHNKEPPLLGQDVKGSSSSLDVAGVDNLLVFWPDRLVDLACVQAAEGKHAASLDGASATYLAGHIVYGHPYEAVIVIVGTIQIINGSDVLDIVASHGLNIVGSFFAAKPTSTDGRISSSSSIWLTVMPSPSRSELLSIQSVRFTSPLARKDVVDSTSSHPANEPCAISLISYSVPNTRMLQYFTLESLRLAPVSGMKLVSTASALLLPDARLADFPHQLTSAPLALENKFLQLLMLDPQLWRSQRYNQPESGRMPRGTALRRSIELINQLQARLGHLVLSSASTTKNGFVNGASKAEDAQRWNRQVSQMGNSVTSMALGVQRILRYPLYTPNERTASIGGVAHRPTPTSFKSSSLRLTSISACARQLDVRISQLAIAPRLASRLRYIRKEQKLPIDAIAAPYIGLWNAIWLIANDIILGHAVSVLLLQNKALLAQVCRSVVERYLLNSVLWLLSWLENWPAGLKLNTELSLFFSDAYSSLTTAWHVQGLVHVLTRLETIIAVMSIVGRLMGVTMVLCMVQDLVSIFTLHITIFYTLSFRTLRAFIYVLSALFDVFRGKKRNALRGGRLDDASYELDQLLLGTLLFTLVAFLFPTVYVYYLAFGLIRFAVVGFEVGVVETGLGLLNHLPLFALMLRLKDPHRLPAGVWIQEADLLFRPDEAHGNAVLQTARFRLRCRPLSIGNIFEGYGQHVGGLVEVPSMLLRCVFGRPLRSSSSTSH